MLLNLLIGIPIMLVCLLFQAVFVAICVRRYGVFRQRHALHRPLSQIVLLGLVMLLALLGNFLQMSTWAGVFVLLSPVYGLAATADLFVFNTIEFWSGKNPITGKSPALVDQKLDALIKVNQHLDPSLNKVPLAMLPQGVREVEVSYPDERTAQMEVHYLDGRSSLMRGEKRGALLDIYFDGRLVSTLTPAQLDELTSHHPAMA